MIYRILYRGPIMENHKKMENEMEAGVYLGLMGLRLLGETQKVKFIIEVTAFTICVAFTCRGYQYIFHCKCPWPFKSLEDIKTWGLDLGY